MVDMHILNTDTKEAYMQRMLQAACMVFTLLGLWVGAAWAVDLQPIPKLTQPVMDTANMLSEGERAQLNQQLEQYAKSKGSQIAVLTVNTTAPEDAFSYGMRVVRSWQLGRAKENDGVLLLIAKDDRKNQILVGRGSGCVCVQLDFGLWRDGVPRWWRRWWPLGGRWFWWRQLWRRRWWWFQWWWRQFQWRWRFGGLVNDEQQSHRAVMAALVFAELAHQKMVSTNHFNAFGARHR